MNCYTDESNNKFYCLNPINPDCYYYDNLESLYCREDDSKNPLHRLDGPAIECINGDKFWYYYGKEINCHSNKEFIKIISMKVFL